MKKYYILVLSLSLSLGSLYAQSSAYSSFSQDSTIFEKAPHVDVAKSLYGALPGVFVQGVNATSATNNASLTIHGKSPLVLIDGFQRDISEIYNLEIEKVTLLKDAASLAIYGVQGANGVILIETKRGTNAPLRVSANYQFGLSTSFREAEFADAYTYASALNEARINDGLTPKYNDLELAAFKSGSLPSLYANVDWMDQVYNDFGYNHRLNFTFEGGSEQFRYFTMIDYMHDTALYRGDSDDLDYTTSPIDTRLGIRGNIDVNLTPTTLLNFGVMGRISENNLSAGASQASAAAFNTPSAAFPVRLDDGVYGSADGYAANNPTALLRSTGIDNLTSTTLIANLKLSQQLDAITKGLSAQASISFDYKGSMFDNVEDSYRYGEYNSTILSDGTVVTAPAYDGEDASVLTYDSDFSSLMVRSEVLAGLNYARSFCDHSLSAALLYTHNSTILNGQNTSVKHQAGVGQVSYDFAKRYFVDFATSYSGTSYLEAGSRFNWYPAVNVAWMASNEGFLEGCDLISSLKLFTSYGLSATDSALTYGLYSQYYSSENANSYIFTTSYTPNYGQAENDLPAEYLRPEESLRFTAGVNLALLDNRLSLYAEYFNDERRNVLVTMGTVSSVIGIDLTQQSIGATDYRGLDFGVSFRDRKGDWGYGVQLTGSYYRSEIINNGQAYQKYDYLYQSGNEVNQQYGLEAIGFFADQVDINNSPTQSFGDVTAGDVKYKDQNGDGVIDSNDVVKMFDSSDPSFTFGAALDFSYRGWELSALFQGVSGVTKSLLGTGLYDPLVNYGNLSKAFLERETYWSAETAADATMPRLSTLTNSNNYQASSLWLRDFSYVKLRNLTLAYNIPNRVLGFAAAKVYLQATDLFSIDNIGFVDPEVISSENYLSTQAFWAGVKFNF
ncbi:MAG: SusC/RagA family TonB-linked outer membrane protein [Rikenellaceae bacterium]